MILEIQIPDDVFQQYGSAEAIQNQVVETVGRHFKDNDVKYTLDSRQLADLRHHFGPFHDATDLVKRIVNVGSVKVQGKAFQLSADQVQNLKVQAYFMKEGDEPSSEAQAIREDYPKDGQKLIVQRHLETVLSQAMDLVLGVTY